MKIIYIDALISIIYYLWFYKKLSKFTIPRNQDANIVRILKTLLNHSSDVYPFSVKIHSV